MHAAHERINYNRIRREIRSRASLSQALLLSLEIELSYTLVENLRDYEDLLASAGFDIEISSDTTVCVRAVPHHIAHSDIPAVIKEIAAHGLDSLERGLDHVAARLACHASIRSGDTVQPEHVSSLLEELDRAELASACPHGRPVVVAFDRPQVERWFGRDR
jgi:DNA mismatch repair protein MutL